VPSLQAAKESQLAALRVELEAVQGSLKEQQVKLDQRGADLSTATEYATTACCTAGMHAHSLLLLLLPFLLGCITQYQRAGRHAFIATGTVKAVQALQVLISEGCRTFTPCIIGAVLFCGMQVRQGQDR